MREKTAVDRKISALIGRPALIGHLGEFIASWVFDIELEQSASHKGSDGHFRGGPLARKTVNVKWYALHEGILDIHSEPDTDYYLVLSGPPASAENRRVRDWVVESVFLFDTTELLAALGGKTGIAAGVKKDLWSHAEIHPNPNNPRLVLTAEQRSLLALFARVAS